MAKSNNKVVVYEKEITPLTMKAGIITIESAKDMRSAGEMLSKLNQQNDHVIAEKERITKPLNEALKVERGRWKPIELLLQVAIKSIRDKMSIYQTNEIKRKREEEAKIAARVGEGKGKLKVETAIKKIEQIEEVEVKVTSEAGMVKFREDKILKITDINKVVRHAVRSGNWTILSINESELLKQLKEGAVVPGAEVEIKMVPLNYR